MITKKNYRHNNIRGCIIQHKDEAGIISRAYYRPERRGSKKKKDSDYFDYVAICEKHQYEERRYTISEVRRLAKDVQDWCWGCFLTKFENAAYILKFKFNLFGYTRNEAIPVVNDGERIGNCFIFSLYHEDQRHNFGVILEDIEIPHEHFFSLQYGYTHGHNWPVLSVMNFTTKSPLPGEKSLQLKDVLYTLSES